MRWLDEAAPDDAVVHEVPDALAVFDEAGELVGWDESPVCAYLAACGLPSPCDADCVARGHVSRW